MKKVNGLVLAAGIIFVVSSVVCLGLGALAILDMLFLDADAFLQISADLASLIYGLYKFSFVIIILFYLCEFLVYLIFGIKLIIAAGKKKKVSECKSLVITAQVLGYVGATLTLTLYIGYDVIAFILIITASILLSVALSRKQNTEVETINTNNEPSSIEPTYQNLNVEQNFKNLESADNKNIDDLTKKIEMLSTLQKDGIITKESYHDMICKLLGIEVDTKSKKETPTKKGGKK